MLTSRENFFAMMGRGRPQRLPFDLPMTPPIRDMMERVTGKRDPVEAFGADFCDCGVKVPGNPGRWRAAFRELGFELPANAEIESTGITHLHPRAESTGAAYHFREMLHPLSEVTEVGQLEALPWPDFPHAEGKEKLAAEIREIHRRGKVAVAPVECTIFESAWYLRGMDNLFGDLLEGNAIGPWLLDWFTEFSCRRVRLAAQAGADVIGLGDDVGTQRGMMMSVEFWREHLKPRLKKVIAAVREAQKEPVLIRYHSDGDIRPIIDELAEIGVDILNPVQPECMSAAEIVACHQHHLGFWGMIGTQTTMPFGSRRDVEAAVEVCAQWAEKGAAVILAPTHVLEPEVPWRNIEALVEAVRTRKLRGAN